MQPGLAWVYMYALNSEIKLWLVMSYGSSRVVTVPSAVSSIPKDSPTNLDILTHYLRRLTDEAQYLEIVKQGHWLWEYITSTYICELVTNAKVCSTAPMQLPHSQTRNKY